MRSGPRRKFLNVVSISVALMASSFLWASAAHAHDPLFLLPDQETPAEGPLLPDGTISFALYGEFISAGETRGFQAQFREGDLFQLELLIPALDPEQSLDENELPYLQLVSPDNSTQMLYPNIRTRFDEPFTNTSYYTLVKERGSAQEGIYEITIIARAPARFTTAIGTSERFGTPVERAGSRPSSFSETSERLGEWYNKPNSPEKIETENEVSSSSVNQGLETQKSRDDLQENPSSGETSGDETQYRERESVDQEMADPESSNSSANQTMWLVIIIAVVAVPVIFAINRILKSTPK